MRAHRHSPVREQHRQLVQKLRGHYAYYGVTGNYRALAAYLHWVKRLWKKWLDRRSNSRRLSWDKMQRMMDVYPLPSPRIVHLAPRRT